MIFRRRAHSNTRLGPSGPIMSPEAYVEALYELCLGRPSDPDGLAFWTERLRETGDATDVLNALRSSEEAQLRSRSVDRSACISIAMDALAVLARHPRVVDVGAQSLGVGTHAYSPLLELTAVDIVGFDPLAQRLGERAASEAAGGDLTLLPYAIGDGAVHTFHVNNDDSTSSLFPLNVTHNERFNHLSTLSTVRTERVETHRLDDVLPPGPIDLLQIDVQGAELMVLQGANSSLSRTSAVHCEVEFSPIYLGQPLYPEVHDVLAAHGFYLVDLLVPGHYHYLTRSGRIAPDRLLWADVVYFRETDDTEALCSQALIASGGYSKPTLGEYLLDRALHP